MKHVKSYLTAGVFLLVLLGFAAGHLLLPDRDISEAERRKLAKPPQLTTAAVLSGKYGEDLEDYLLDQFPLRDAFRSLKAEWQLFVWQMKDNNGIYLADGSICKLDKELKENQVNAAVNNANTVYDTYLQGMNVYFALIPDKNYFAAQANGYPALDYSGMSDLLAAGLNENIQYLGMAPFQSLTLADYYTTDLHWRQERLGTVVDALSDAMGFASTNPGRYDRTEYPDFYGAYYGQSALRVPADTLVTLSSPATDAAIVTGAEFAGEKAVYDPYDADNADLYDLYLGGAQAILTVTNPNGTAGKDLILFRDSFGSSLAPLLLDSYDTITLIDLRYVTTALLEQYVELADQDVLFLYNTGPLSSALLRE